MRRQLLALAITIGVTDAAGCVPAPDRSAGTLLRDCDDCPEMVIIPAGRFTMGADAGERGRPEGPPHTVTIARSFAAGRFEITRREFAAFVAATGYSPPTGCGRWDAALGRPVLDPALDWRSPGSSQPPRDDEPVVCVSWHDAQAYARWLSRETGKSYRLLSEAEWEYLARGRSQGEYAWGDDPDAGCRFANVFDQSADASSKPIEPAACDDGFAEVAPAGRLEANAFGVHDIIGNVWEWVQDCYVAPYPADTPTDGRALDDDGACERRSIRGGSWRSPMFRQRPSWRGRDPEDARGDIFGFRVARELP